MLFYVFNQVMPDIITNQSVSSDSLLEYAKLIVIPVRKVEDK